MNTTSQSVQIANSRVISKREAIIKLLAFLNIPSRRILFKKPCDFPCWLSTGLAASSTLTAKFLIPFLLESKMRASILPGGPQVTLWSTLSIENTCKLLVVPLYLASTSVKDELRYGIFEIVDLFGKLSNDVAPALFFCKMFSTRFRAFSNAGNEPRAKALSKPMVLRSSCCHPLRLFGKF